MTTYYLLLKGTEIVGVGLAPYTYLFDGVTTAMFASVTPPKVGGTFSNGVYTIPPVSYYLGLSWGAGVATVDGMNELVSDGANTAVLTLQKKEEETDVAQTAPSDNDSYRVCVTTGNVTPDVGKVSLINGVATVTFAPPASEKGILTIDIIPVSGAPAPKQTMMLSLV